MEQGRADRPEQVDPPEKSTNEAPALVGGPPGSPVVAALPDIACTVMSIVDIVRRGPGSVVLAGGNDQTRLCSRSPGPSTGAPVPARSLR